jgi:hypothetical protein
VEIDQIQLFALDFQTRTQRQVVFAGLLFNYTMLAFVGTWMHQCHPSCQ